MQALKDVALRLLNVYVSPYVENLNSQDLTLSVFGGNLQFHSLHLKKTLLERFGLPVDIVAGDIGTLSVTIPWTQLKTQPVKISIDDVYVLARARPPGKVDPEEDERVEQATKQERLKSAEAVDQAASQVGPAGSDQAKQTYIGAIISKVVDNVQIHVRNIHVRYEDATNTPEHPFAAGVTLSEFKAVSTDENWVETFIQDSMKGVHKLVKLAALSVYFDTDTGSIEKQGGTRQDTIDALRQMLTVSGKHQYILKPVTGEARLIVNKSMSNEIPKVDGQIIFDEIGVVLDRDQYRDALSVLDVFHFYRRTHQYHKFRPPESEFSTNPARARLKFALQAIGAEVHDKHRRWTWEYLSERRDTRKRYVDVYVKRLALPEGKPLPPEDATALAEMEQKLSYEDIRFFRSVARAKAKQDAATRRKLDLERKKEQAGRQTWGEWLWGTGPKDASEDGMTDAEKKELDDIIDYDAAAAIVGDAPKDFIKARVSARLNKGSFALRVDPHGRTADIIELVFDTFTADATQYTDSLAAKVALGGFTVIDGTMPGSLYRKIVHVKDIENASRKGKGKQSSFDIEGSDVALAEISEGLSDEADPFFVVDFEHNPLDGRADNAIAVRMRHLEIIYHKGYVEAVVQFLKPPESQLESIGALLDAAGQTLDGIRKETRAGLEYALDQHKTVDIRVDMNAPIIIIPMDVKAADCQALVLDAGHIAVESTLADQSRIKEVQAKRGKQYSDDDYKQLEDLMYDRMSLRLESTQLLMGGNVESCLQALDRPHEAGATDLHILEKINMNFSVQNAIVNTSSLTRFKIAGELPELQVNFSDRKYKTLMRFIDVAVPKLGDDDAPPPEVQPVVRERRNATFRAAPIEEYNLEDNRSIHSLRTVDSRDDGSSVDDKGEKFYEAHDDTTETQRNAIQQVSFEFSFQVGRLQASLFKAVTPVDERALADAVLEGFGLTFALRKYDMSVDLYLRNVTLSMIERGQARKPLLSSAHAADDDSTSDLKLVRVKYMRVQKNSPEFMTKHDGVDQSVETELSTFNITVAPEPILALNDFIMTAFVSPPDAEQQVAPAGKAGEEDAPPVPESADKIRVRVRLTSAQVSLENNGLKFALLALPSADVAIMLRSGTMRVGARLGNLSLEDLTDDKVANPEFKKLLAIEGSELADFSYETFDPTDKDIFPGYNSSVHLRTGSLRFTFMDGPVRSLYGWALKFARLKAVYDAASQAAVQRAAEVTRMHYDVVIKTPIVILPRDGLTSEDVLILRLGEIFAKNEYLGDPNDTSTINAGLRGISVSSEILHEGKKGTLRMVDDVAISASVKQAGGSAHRKQGKADTEVTTEMSDVKMSLTQPQYVLLMGILQALPNALSDIEDVEISAESLPPSGTATTSATAVPTPDHSSEASVDLGPELIPKTNGSAPWTSLQVEFTVNSIAFEVYTDKAMAPEDLKRNSIARFALVRTRVGMKQLSDGAMEAELSLKTIAFTSTRTSTSAFKDIIPSATHDGNQIMLQYSKAGNGDALAIATVDHPTLVLAVEPLAALLEFAVSPFKSSEPEPQPEIEVKAVAEQQQAPAEGPTSGGLSFRVEIIQSKVLVIADDSDPRSQAIQLEIREILLSQQTIMALKIGQLGMSFGRMSNSDLNDQDKITFLDRLNVALTLDTKRRGAQVTTNFDVDIPDPIIFRASYADIMLILDIVNKASSATTRAMGGEPVPEGRRGSVGDRRSSIAPDAITESTAPALAKQSMRRTSVSKRRTSIDKAKVLVSKEQLQARINGFQLVLVGDVQEMPFIHLATNEFQIAINDWTGDMKLATSITTAIRYYNPSNSYFEPFMDPWRFDMRVTRTAVGQANPMDIRFSARERLELNVSAALIELLMTGTALWGQKGEKQLREQKGTGAPFRIRNKTGLRLEVWPESRRQTGEPRRLDDGADIPWRFTDRHRARDNISAVRHNSLGIRLLGTRWNDISGIQVDREGQQILHLHPKKDKVSHQIMCDIKVENNIKIITFRSTFDIENNTAFAVEMIIVDSHGKASTGQIRIEPGASHPLPLEAAYEKRFRVRPQKGFNFDFSWSMPLHWRQLVARPIRPISCKHQDPRKSSFYFQAQANFDENDPAAKIYPRMTLSLRAPVELENLLPFDFKWRVHDKNTGVTSGEFLTKGGSHYLHDVELSHLLLISLAPQDCHFQQSEYAIINTDDPELPIEDHFQVTDQENIGLTLRIHYYTYPNSGGAIKAQIYTPYVFINKTGLSFDLATRVWSGGQREVAARALFANDYKRPEPTPFMFNFSNADRKDRLLLRVDNSKWSKPMGFDSPAADMAVLMQSEQGDTEKHVGLSYAEGLGKYKLTKVITIAPRFIVVNKFKYPIKLRQEQTDRSYEIGPDERLPLIELFSRAPTQLVLTADMSTLRWSAPFNATDIGRTHLVVSRQDTNRLRTYLMRVEIHISGSSFFIYISRETEPWPLKIRNDTSLKFTFQQIDEDKAATQRPIRQLPPNQVVDYAWDRPTAEGKRIRLIADGGVPLPEGLDMMAIGVQPPIKLPRIPGKRAATISVNIQADGASQLLVISPYDEETSIFKPTRRPGPRRSESTDSLATTTQFETVHVSERPTMTVSVNFAGIGLSVITKRPDELVYLSLRGLSIGYADYPTMYDAFIDCKWIQIDNQLFGGLYPIILFPQNIPKDGKDLESHPTLQGSAAILKGQSHGVIYVKYASVLLQSLSLEIDEDFLFALLDFTKFKGASWGSEPEDVLIEHPKEIPEPDIQLGQADYFFEMLHLQPLAISLSFMRTERVNVDEKVSTRNPFYYALNALTMALGNVNEAPIKFTQLLVENARLSLPSLQERVTLHYSEQVVPQIYRVLGSADFLGNPMGLFNQVSSGVSDIFYEPYQGVVMHGNKDIGLGIARGASSFAKKTVFGITDSMTKFTGSIGKGLAAATLDAEYQTKRRMDQRRNKPRHALYGIARGASQFANSVTSAFEGVASKPMEGAEKAGAVGFVKGIGTGFIGLMTKPAGGVFDFVSSSTEGLRNTTTVFDQDPIDKVRLPRFIASDGVLRSFSEREALGQNWLKEIRSGEYGSEPYVAHLDIPGDDTVALLSEQRLVQIQLRKMREIWQVPLNEMQSLSLEENGIALVLRGGQSGPFLPISDKAARDWFFKNIGRVVTAYNKRHTTRDDY